MNYIKILLYSAALIFFSGCTFNQGSHGHTHDVIGGHGDHEPHEHEEVMMSFTFFTSDFEFFVEFPPLVVGQTGTFIAHFTELADYKPVTQGRLTVSIIKDGKGLRHSVESPVSPGIFKPSLQPKEAGIYRLVFEKTGEKGALTFEIPEIEVFPDSHKAAHAIPSTVTGDATIFLKEQAWNTEFMTMEVLKQSFHSVIKTSARVKNHHQFTRVLTANLAGLVNIFVVNGESVQTGDLLATVTSSGIENNISIKLYEFRIAFERSKADYARTKPLAEKQAISQKEFLEILSRYKQDSILYSQMAKIVSENGLKIIAPFDGYVSEITVSGGEFIEAGKSVITVSNKKQLLIEAFVNQSDFQRVNSIFDAHFRLPGNNKTLTLSEINGKVSAANAFVNEAATRIPVIFSVNNTGILIPGMFIEAFLMTEKKYDVLVVPLSSIIEEQGFYYVFVQTGGESFIKRPVKLANNDGLNVEILTGLNQGERIVSKGAFQIKLAAMAGDLPLHGHTH